MVDIGEVGAHEMVEAGREDQHSRRQLGQALQDIGDTVDDQPLIVTADEVFFQELDGGKSVHSTALSGSQNDTAKTAGGADIDLVCLRQLKAGMNDVPGAAGWWREFERAGEKLPRIRVFQQPAGPVGMTIDFL